MSNPTLADMTADERQQMIGRWCEDQSGDLVVYVRDSLPTENGNKWGASALVIGVDNDPALTSHRPWLKYLTPRLDLPPAWTPDRQPLPGKWQWRDNGFPDEGRRTEARARRDATEYSTDVERRFVTEWEEA